MKLLCVAYHTPKLGQGFVGGSHLLFDVPVAEINEDSLSLGEGGGGELRLIYIQMTAHLPEIHVK